MSILKKLKRAWGRLSTDEKATVVVGGILIGAEVVKLLRQQPKVPPLPLLPLPFPVVDFSPSPTACRYWRGVPVTTCPPAAADGALPFDW